MAASTEVVLAYWNEHRQQLRQSENQRAILTNYLLVITAALTGLIVAQRFASATLAAAILIVMLGLYGALAVAKYHERANYHLGQARALTQTLKDLQALNEDTNTHQARQKHQERHQFLYQVRLHWLWTGLHLAIAGFGLALAIVILGH